MQGGSEALLVTRPVLAEGIEQYLAAVRRPSPPPPSLEAGRLLADRAAHRLAYRRPPGMAVCDSYVADGAAETPIRIYRPIAEAGLPAIVYLHGGGFTTGSVESYDCLAAALSEATAAVVISVHYARLPDATPREALEQGYGILCWAARMAGALGIDSTCLSVAGDSAGAFLAAHLAVLSRDRGGPGLACQLLSYGMYDLDLTRPAYAEARDPVMTRALAESVIGAYRTCDARSDDPVCAPLEIADLSRLPAAVMLGAEHDPLRAEAGDYAARLRAAGVAVTERVAPGMCHGFLRAVAFSQPARDEMAWLGATFRNILQTRTRP